MFKYLLQNSGQDINWMALFALITFVVMFLIGTLTILSRNKGYIEKMSNMPLEDNQPINSETVDQHEK